MIREIIEEPLELRDGGRVVTFGTPDYVAHCEATDAVIVVDHKFGRGDVPEPAATLQLMLLLAMAMQKTGAARGDGYIHCVRADKQMHTSLTREQIPEVIAMVDRTREACLRDDAPLATGEHCHYCRGVGLCDATRTAADVAIIDSVDVSVYPTERDVKAEIKTWPAKRLLASLDNLKLLEWIIAAWRSRAHEIMKQDPDALDGWERWERRGRRSCKGGPQALLECVDDVLSPADVLAECKVSVSAVERRFVDLVAERDENGKLKRGEGPRAKKAFAERVADVVSQGTEFHLRKRKGS